MIFKILLGVLFFTSVVIAQKPHYYYNENGKPISQRAFKKFREGLIQGFKENDTCTIHRLETRFVQGVLTEAEYDQVKKALVKGFAHYVSGKVCIINFFPGLDPCNETILLDHGEGHWEQYEEWVAKYPKAMQFYVNAIPNSWNYFPKGSKSMADADNVFRTLFFRAHYPCGSYAIVEPNRTFYVYKGEYDFRRIINYLEVTK